MKGACPRSVQVLTFWTTLKQHEKSLRVVLGPAVAEKRLDDDDDQEIGIRNLKSDLQFKKMCIRDRYRVSRPK